MSTDPNQPEPPKCPWCGAPATWHSYVYDHSNWKCGTVKRSCWPKQSDKCSIRELKATAERLTAIVDTHPRTADDVPAVDNMRLYVIHPETGAISTWRPNMQPQTIKLRSTTDRDAYHEFAVSDSYSTLKAAEAAKGGE